MGMDQGTDILNGFFKHAMGGGIGYHDGRQRVGILFRLSLKVVHVHIAVIVTFDDLDLHACHDRAGWIGAMGG